MPASLKHKLQLYKGCNTFGQEIIHVTWLHTCSWKWVGVMHYELYFTDVYFVFMKLCKIEKIKNMKAIFCVFLSDWIIFASATTTTTNISCI